MVFGALTAYEGCKQLFVKMHNSKEGYLSTQLIKWAGCSNSMFCWCANHFYILFFTSEDSGNDEASILKNVKKTPMLFFVLSSLTFWPTIQHTTHENDRSCADSHRITFTVNTSTRYWLQRVTTKLSSEWSTGLFLMSFDFLSRLCIVAYLSFCVPTASLKEQEHSQHSIVSLSCFRCCSSVWEEKMELRYEGVLLVSLIMHMWFP